MSRWLDDFLPHSFVKSASQLADRVGSKRVQGNEKVKEFREQKEKAKLERQHNSERSELRIRTHYYTHWHTSGDCWMSISYPDLCWVLPTTVWTYLGGKLPSRSWPECQMCSGQPCEQLEGWQEADGAETAVCGGLHAHLLHLVEGEMREIKAAQTHKHTQLMIFIYIKLL